MRGALALWCVAMLLTSGADANDSASGWRTETVTPPPVAPGAAKPAPRTLTPLEQKAAETVRLTNEFRRRNGLPEFANDPTCTAAAVDHAQDMARRSYFNHFSPEGGSPTSRYRRRNTSGQRVIRVTENIARGNETTPEDALKMWLNSAGHRKHLVGTEMNHMGIGVANGTCFFAACTYFVQCFSRRP